MPVHSFNVDTTGSAGSATGSFTSNNFDLSMIEAIKIHYDGAAPATTDVVISEAEGLAQQVLSVADSATDGTYYPRHALHDVNGAELTSVGAFIIEGPLTISVTGCDELTAAVTVHIKTVNNRDVT